MIPKNFVPESNKSKIKKLEKIVKQVPDLDFFVSAELIASKCYSFYDKPRVSTTWLDKDIDLDRMGLNELELDDISKTYIARLKREIEDGESIWLDLCVVVFKDEEIIKKNYEKLFKYAQDVAKSSRVLVRNNYAIIMAYDNDYEEEMPTALKDLYTHYKRCGMKELDMKKVFELK